jgi:hypothetical protein
MVLSNIGIHQGISTNSTRISTNSELRIWIWARAPSQGMHLTPLLPLLQLKCLAPQAAGLAKHNFKTSFFFVFLC